MPTTDIEPVDHDAALAPLAACAWRRCLYKREGKRESRSDGPATGKPSATILHIGRLHGVPQG